jgi:uncharacterized protein
VLHAGDIGDPKVLEGLRSIATLDAVRGNNDIGRWAARIPESQQLEIGGVHLLVLHDRADLAGAPPPGTRVVIVGHSHKPMVELREDILYVNPGSAGPRRFRLPIAAGELRIEGRALEATLVDLLTRRPIPGMSARLVL